MIMVSAPTIGKVNGERTAQPELPPILIRARERSAQRLVQAYVLAGIFFMLVPGTFLGVWNLLAISGRHSAAILSPWIQAHGHAQIFGWIGTFILGIGFYSIPKSGERKMSGITQQPAMHGWAALILWSTGVLLRWSSGVYQWHWRVLLPLSGLLELSAFLIFLRAVSGHRRIAPQADGGKPPLWVVLVLVGALGFGIGVAMNLLAGLYASVYGVTPTYPAGFESRFLTLLLYAFIVPTIWGFNLRWLPVFLGLRAVNERVLGFAVILNITGVALTLPGFSHTAPWLFAVAAALSAGAFHLLSPAERKSKTTGVHPSFSSFVRIAYLWLMVATILGICAAFLDHGNGWTGGSRHALTVGFISTMVFAVGQRVLPAFAGMRILYSPRLMLGCLLLLNLGCTLRVTSEILAYEGYWLPAWHALPYSAVCELAAVTLFAANLLFTFLQPPAHPMKCGGAL
jgi:hypothetical protein